MIEEVDKKESTPYATLVQNALLPKKRHFDRLFEDHFVMFRPKNIVSGDFYWVGEKRGLKYIAVGDCVGHGTSAALLSVLVLNLLEYVIMNKGIKRVDKIMREIDKKFTESFSSISNQRFDTPWIDMSLICIDNRKSKMYFASGNRTLLHVPQEGTPNLLKGSNYPIGGWQVQEDRNFYSICSEYKKGDSIYLGSDGYQDQFGGSNNKRYYAKNLHQLLERNAQSSFNKQLTILQDQFQNWKQEMSQTDDVCIVGIKL